MPINKFGTHIHSHSRTRPYPNHFFIKVKSISELYYETPLLILARKTNSDGFYFVGMGEIEYKFPLTSGVVVRARKNINKIQIYVNNVVINDLVGMVLKRNDILKFKIDNNTNSDTIMQVDLLLKCSLLQD